MLSWACWMLSESRKAGRDMGYKQPRFMHIPDTMAKGIRQCHEVSCNKIESRPKKPEALATITRKTKNHTRWTPGICSICGEWCEMITQKHAHGHGFKNADEMAKAGIVK